MSGGMAWHEPFWLPGLDWPMIPLRLLTLALTAALAFAVAGAAQIPQNTPPAAPSTRPAGLPEAWFGSWRGTVQVMRPGGEVASEFGMSLEIGPAPDQPAGALPAYAWAITYEMGDQKQTRPYLLRIATDEAGQPRPGHFVLDERNGILVDQFLVGKVMQGHFIVESNGRRQILHARYELVQDEAGQPAIDTEIATYDGDESRRSTLDGGGVDSRRLLRLQAGMLKRQ